MKMENQAWKGFHGGEWQRSIDVRSFIQMIRKTDGFMLSTFIRMNRVAPWRDMKILWYFMRFIFYMNFQGGQFSGSGGEKKGPEAFVA